MKVEPVQLAPMIKQLYSEHTKSRDIVGILIPDNILAFLIGHQDDPQPIENLLSDSEFKELVFCLFHNRVADNLHYVPEEPEEEVEFSDEEIEDEDFYEFLSLVIYRLPDKSVVVVDRPFEQSGDLYEITLEDVESVIEEFEGAISE
jgi:hypothetical protein